MSTTKYLSADKFLSRSIGGCLYVGHCASRSDVEKILRAAALHDVELGFEDNPRQPNYAPTVRVLGDDSSVLRFVASLTNMRHGPDEIEVKATYTELWWD